MVNGVATLRRRIRFVGSVAIEVSFQRHESDRSSSSGVLASRSLAAFRNSSSEMEPSSSPSEAFRSISAGFWFRASFASLNGWSPWSRLPRSRWIGFWLLAITCISFVITPESGIRTASNSASRVPCAPNRTTKERRLQAPLLAIAGWGREPRSGLRGFLLFLLHLLADLRSHGLYGSGHLLLLLQV